MLNKSEAHIAVEDLAKASAGETIGARYERARLEDPRIDARFVHNRIEALAIVVSELKTRVSAMESKPEGEAVPTVAADKSRLLQPGLYRINHPVRVIERSVGSVTELGSVYSSQDIIATMQATAYLVEKGLKPYAQYGYGNVIGVAKENGWDGCLAGGGRV